MKIFLYKVTSPSNKVYIGKSCNIKKRVASHIYRSKNRYNDYNHLFKKAIRKYSPENLLWEVIDIAKDTNTANELERRYILHFNCYINGYNMTLGGDGGSYYNYSKKEILNICKTCNTKTELSKKYNAIATRLLCIKETDISFYKKCTSHMKVFSTDWTEEMIMSIAQDYSKIKDFKSNNRTAWKAALRFGKDFYKKCTSHMKKYKPTPSKWTKPAIKAAALKFNRKVDMRNHNNRAYQALNNIKHKDLVFYNECIAHMKTRGST